MYVCVNQKLCGGLTVKVLSWKRRDSGFKFLSRNIFLATYIDIFMYVCAHMYEYVCVWAGKVLSMYAEVSKSTTHYLKWVATLSKVDGNSQTGN